MPNGHPQKKLEGYFNRPILIDAHPARYNLLGQPVRCLWGSMATFSTQAGETVV